FAGRREALAEDVRSEATSGSSRDSGGREVEEASGRGARVTGAVHEGDGAAEARPGGADGGTESARGSSEGVREERRAGPGQHQGDERVALGRLHANVGPNPGVGEGDVDHVPQRRAGGA